jgi:hypothetical protein
MRSSFPLRLIFLSLVLSAMTGLVSASYGTVQIFAHPGGGMVCVAGQCQSDVGTANGIGSAQFQVSCGREHSIVDYYTPGYQSYHDSVYMDYNCDPVTRDIYLVPVPAVTATPAPSTGSIQVFISPDPGSGEICLDNNQCQVDEGPASDVWSVEWSGVSSDKLHTLSIDNNGVDNGYGPAEQQVSVKPGEIATVNINLVPVASGTPAGSTPAPSAPAAATTASPLPGEVVVLAIGAGGALVVFRNRSR